MILIRRKSKLSKYLYGRYIHNIDAKGRLSIPAKYRDILGYDLILALGPDENLVLYNRDDWDEVIKKYEEQIDTSDPEGRAFLGMLTDNACACEVDSQGRIVVSPLLRGFAGLTREVVITGRGIKAVIWDKARYEEINGKIEVDDSATYKDMADALKKNVSKYKLQF